MTLLAVSVVFAALASSSGAPGAPAGPDPEWSPGAAAPGDNQEGVHQPRADRWLARNGFDPAAPPELEALLAEGFAHLPLGIFDVMILPSALTDKERLEDIKDAVDALLKVQMEWIDWLPPTDGLRPAPGSLEGDAKNLTRWIGKWKTKPFADTAATRGASLLEVGGADGKTHESAKVFQEYMLSGGPVRTLAQPAKPAGLILIPSREDFVEFISTVGAVEMRHRDFFWIEGTATWTQFNFDGNRVVALEFASPEVESDYTKSIAMDYKNSETLAQQVAQLGSRSMIEASVGDGMDSLLVGGLANDLVITIWGEVDTRTDGDTSARSVDAVDVFVHGGNPSGGTVTSNANSRWREKHGAGRFLELLNRSQKNGAKQAKEKSEKLVCFQLLDDSASNEHILRAPFFGGSEGALPPAEFQGDQLEFLRAYRIAFLYWLRTEAGGRSAKERRASFARFTRTLGAGTGLTDAFEEAYGMPLSAPDTESLATGGDSLEGEFLAWIAKQ